MSKTQFTRGPWSGDLTLDDGSKASSIYPTTRARSHLCEPICIIPHDDITDRGQKEVRANFRLIVEAPKLLTMVQRLLPYARAEGREYPGPSNIVADAEAILSRITESGAKE